MRNLLIILLGLFLLVVLGYGCNYFFPDMVMLSDRCAQCGRSRIYFQSDGAKFGSAIFNLKIEAAGNRSPSHHHDYSDPRYTRIGRVPWFKLRYDGLQNQ